MKAFLQGVAGSVGAAALIIFGILMCHEAHAQTYQTYGNTTYGSDGSTAQTYGNTTYYQPPANQPQVICQTYGNTTYCN